MALKQSESTEAEQDTETLVRQALRQLGTSVRQTK